MSFYAVLIASIASLLWLRAHYGVRAMVALAWAYSFILPTMLQIHIFGALVEIRPAVLLFVVANLIFTGERWLPERWLWIDTLAVCLVISQLISEGVSDHIGPSAILGYGLDWMLPYLFGRLTLQSLDDMRRLVRAAAYVIVVLCAAAATEAITRVNPLHLIVAGPAAFHVPSDVRWGMRRAEGPSQHPISFGMMLVLLMPWAIEGAAQARAGRGPRWWRHLPWLNGAAVFFAMSRGPQVAAVICLFGLVCFRYPAWRLRLITGLGAAALFLAVGRDYAVNALHVWSNEDGQHHEHYVINGVSMEYSGTNHRILQLLVYEEAALNAGFFGYGTLALSTTPSTIPFVDPELEVTFHSIDNHYLCFLLSKGYLGIGLFILLAVSVLCALWRPAMTLDAPQSTLAAAMFSILVGQMIILTTVWFCFAFGCNWLILAGMAVSLRQQFELGGVESPAAASDGAPHENLNATPFRTFAPARRLVPGHPQIGIDSTGSLTQA